MRGPVASPTPDRLAVGKPATTVTAVVIPSEPRLSNPLLRFGAVLLGLMTLGLGLAGFVVPGLPGVPFLLVAAWAFSMSNDRLYRWMMANRWFGATLSDYRNGLGIPRRIKAIAVSSVVIVVTSSVVFALQGTVRFVVLALGIVGIWFILTRPTRVKALAADI